MAQIDIATIKTNIKSILDTANTTTGSPIDLSSGLSNRVQQVFKVNPNRIPIQADLFPFVTCFLNDKEIDQITMGHGTQTNALRQAVISISIMSAVCESAVSDITADTADENIEKLMENVEEILRSNTTISSSVNWAMPTNITYHTIQWDEETHVRASLMNLNCKVFY